MHSWISEEKIDEMKDSAFRAGWILGCVVTGICTIAVEYFINR